MVTIYSKIKTWIWFNIITKYWNDYIKDEINDNTVECPFFWEYDKSDLD